MQNGVVSLSERFVTPFSNLIIGFHGCDKLVVDAVIAGKTGLLASYTFNPSLILFVFPDKRGRTYRIEKAKQERPYSSTP